MSDQDQDSGGWRYSQFSWSDRLLELDMYDGQGQGASVQRWMEPSGGVAIASRGKGALIGFLEKDSRGPQML